MKQVIILLFLTAILFSAAACQPQKQNDAAAAQASAPANTPVSTPESSPSPAGIEKKDGVIHITEKLYVGYINEMYTNTSDYLGKTIQIEGMFTSAQDEKTGKTYYYVYRTGPGCCGNDGNMCGFEFTYDGTMPEENDWISVEGVLGSYEEDGIEYLSLKASSVKKLDTRGAETVYQ